MCFHIEVKKRKLSVDTRYETTVIDPLIVLFLFRFLTTVFVGHSVFHHRWHINIFIRKRIKLFEFIISFFNFHLIE